MYFRFYVGLNVLHIVRDGYARNRSMDDTKGEREL